MIKVPNAFFEGWDGDKCSHIRCFVWLFLKIGDLGGSHQMDPQIGPFLEG